MKRKKVFGIMISVLMVFAMIPFQSFGASLPFKDVPSDAWYYNDVKVAYETGLINGMDTTTFAPESNMTYAQAVKLAACMNQKYTSGSVTLENGSPNWYDSYVAYAKSNNIISRDYEWNVSATRAEYAEIFANALPAEALKAKNSVDDWAVPDVDMGHPQSTAIYKLYRAGILNGVDNEGNFAPNLNVKRAEVSAILTRMMNENARKDFTLKFPVTPDTPVNPVAITDTWEEIITSVNDGTYNEKYHIGDTKELDLGTEGIIEMQIAALDTDELADGSGKAAITWISKQVLNTGHCMNSSLITSDSADPLDLSEFVQGTGNIGGWEYSEMRAWLKEEIKPSIPSTVQDAIKPVIKYTFSNDTELNTATVKSTEDVWIPSVREVIGLPWDFENEGPLYSKLYSNDSDRVKKKSGASDASVWWLRSVTHAGSVASLSFASINEDGTGKLLTDYPSVNTPEGVALGFCL